MKWNSYSLKKKEKIHSDKITLLNHNFTRGTLVEHVSTKKVGIITSYSSKAHVQLIGQNKFLFDVDRHLLLPNEVSFCYSWNKKYFVFNYL